MIDKLKERKEKLQNALNILAQRESSLATALETTKTQRFRVEGAIAEIDSLLAKLEAEGQKGEDSREVVTGRPVQPTPTET